MNNDPWHTVTEGNMLRVDPNGKNDFFWAVVEKGSPALVMALEGKVDHDIELPKLRNIDLRLRSVNGAALVLALLDNTHREIFEALCRNIIDAAEGAKDQKTALHLAVQRTRRWHFLLKGGSNTGLTVEQQRGLIGELSFLREIANAVSPETAVEGWTGPDGASKDFEFPTACVEIKARRGAAKPQVRISSEDQLADVTPRRLFLRVYDVESAVLPDGENLHGHVQNTRNLFEKFPVSLDQFEDRLAALGYDKSHDYEKRRWTVTTTRTYEIRADFPRLVSPLVNGVQDVNYSIDLSACEPFEVEFDPYLLVEGTSNGNA